MVGASLVLCAGFGTRLRPLTDWLPKSLVPIGDRAVASYAVGHVRAAFPGARIVANAHHRGDEVRAWAERENVGVSMEEELLGTAGGLDRASTLLGAGDVLVWNADIVSTVAPAALAAAHEAQRAEATLVVTTRAKGEGSVGLSADGRVVRLRGERFGDEEHGGDFHGVHIVGARLRERCPSKGCLVGDVYLPALRRGERIGVHEVRGGFRDVGTIAEYLGVNLDWLLVRGLASWQAEDALVNASIEGSTVGTGARVDAPCLRSVVWPGAHVREPIADAVATPHGVVQVDRAVPRS